MIIKYYNTKKGKYQRFPFWLIAFILFGYPIIFYFLGRLDNPKLKIIEEKVVIKEVEKNDFLEFNEDNFINFLKDINVKFPELVYTQAYHETNKFTSNVFMTSNNLFGMRVPRQRVYLSDCDTCSYSKFVDTKLAGWQMSVLDYTLWQSKYANYKTEDEYIKYLGKVYAEDTLYVQKLKVLKEQLWTHGKKL